MRVLRAKELKKEINYQLENGVSDPVRIMESMEDFLDKHIRENEIIIDDSVGNGTTVIKIGECLVSLTKIRYKELLKAIKEKEAIDN